MRYSKPLNVVMVYQSQIYQCHVGRPHRRKLCIVCFFGVFSDLLQFGLGYLGSLQPVLAYYGLIRVVPFFTKTTSKDVLASQSGTSVITKYSSFDISQSGESVIMIQLFCITKRGKWYYKVEQLFILQRGASGITKQDSYCKLG